VADKMILLIGTYDTKNGKLDYMADRIRSLGGGVTTMDVSVLADPKRPKDYSKHDVALAGGHSIQAAIGSGSVHRALNMLSDGACERSKRLASDRSIVGFSSSGAPRAQIWPWMSAKPYRLGCPNMWYRPFHFYRSFRPSAWHATFR
jgi:uncharacterized protein (UPF0261 family)